MSKTEPDSWLVVALACLSLAFASFAIPNESMPLLTRYYVGGILAFFGLSIRMIDVSMKSSRRTKKKVERAIARAIFARTVIVNLLFAFPVIVWIFVFVQAVRPDIGSFALVYCIVPLVLALGTGFIEYRSFYA